MLERKPRVAIVVSHPIQHFVFLYRELARQNKINLRVLFCSKIGLTPYFDDDMQQEIQWDGDLLKGYDSIFLDEAERISKTGFRSVNNPSVAKHLNQYHPDVVISYGYAQLTQLRTLLWSIRTSTPRLMISDTNNVTHRHYMKKVLRNFFLRKLFKRFNGFLTPGDQNEEALMRLGVSEEKLFRSPFPIDENTYLQVRSKKKDISENLRKTLGIPTNAFVCIMVGKLIDRKNPFDAVNAIEKASETSPNLHLLVCGNGPLEEKLKALVNKKRLPVTFAGFVNTAELPYYYAASDALLHLASRDPHPLVCSESISLGLPLILSSSTGTIG